MKKKLHFLVNIAYYGALALLIVLAVRYLVPVLLPFLLGFFVASAFNSLVSKLSRYRKRAFAAAVVILPFWGVLLFLLRKAGALFYREAAELLEWIQHTDFQEILSRISLPFLEEDTIQWLTQRAEDLLPALVDLARTGLMSLLDLLMGIPDALIFSFVTVFSSYLLSVKYPQIEPFLLRQMSARLQTEYYDVKEFLLRKIFRILRAYGIMLVLNYAQLLIGFWVLNVSYPLILAAVIALFDLLPYVGIPSILVPWGLIEWFVFSDSSLGIGLIVLAVIVFLIRELAEPRVMGKNLGLSPLMSLLSIYLGMKLIGFFGAFLFPLLFLFVKEWNDSGRLPLWKSAPDDS